jgi:hypothetical protein
MENLTSVLTPHLGSWKAYGEVYKDREELPTRRNMSQIYHEEGPNKKHMFTKIFFKSKNKSTEYLAIV